MKGLSKGRYDETFAGEDEWVPVPQTIKISSYQAFKLLALKAPITTAADDKFCKIFPTF